MRTAPRYYLIADDGKIRRLARSTFYKLLEQKIPTLPSLVELAGVELRDRGEEAPIAVVRNHSRNESTARSQSGTRPAIARSF